MLTYTFTIRMEEGNRQELDYFVPPPINELNRNYYQQLEGISNPLTHTTKYYMAFNQVLPLDRSHIKIEGEPLTEQLKDSLKEINKAIYRSMVQYIGALSGQIPLQKIKSPAESVIAKEMAKFVEICESVKKYQTKRGICETMAKQTSLIRERTKQMLQTLKQIKKSFRKANEQYQKCDNTRQ